MSTLPTPLAQRLALRHRLSSDTFDLCIIGGGASGAGCALDAALRGLKVALVERDDFSSGTSSRSTKLVHGGVRYLEQAVKNGDLAQLRQVHHGLRERHRVLANAPHLARPLALLTPVFSWWEGLYYRIGLALYDAFSWGTERLPRTRWLSRREALRRMPGLSPRIHSAVLYHDGQLDDARYGISLALSAAEAGAVLLHHAELLGFEHDAAGRVAAARVHDHLAADYPDIIPAGALAIRARCFLNCTGPFADTVRLKANPALSPRIRPSKGVHAVLPYASLSSEDAMLIPRTRDGRMIFAVPFQGRVLLGTTDEDYPDPQQEPTLRSDEVDFLLDTLNPFLSRPIGHEELRAGFGGLRPLVQPPAEGAAASTRALLRDHDIEQDAASGLFSLLGGKWTTYRLMAQDAVDAICRHLGHDAPCLTAAHPLAGAVGYGPGLWEKIAAAYGISPEIAQHLARQYGSRAEVIAKWLKEQPQWGERLAAEFPYLKAEVVYAVRAEGAFTLRDVLSRRMRLEVLDWGAAMEATRATALLMQQELGWSDGQRDGAAAEYSALLQGFMRLSRARGLEEV
ncbi:MAG TPA: FAD-dependent oxidoreductase [Myxococcota bacterium]|nr:FAD-dependent oxidoreductase [Myxococcota bacterium]